MPRRTHAKDKRPVRATKEVHSTRGECRAVGSTRLLMLATLLVAAVYGVYLLNFILHRQTIVEAFHYRVPEHRGAGQRAEWGVKNRGAPAGVLPSRPSRKEKARAIEMAKDAAAQAPPSEFDSSERAQFLRKAKHAGDIVKPIGHATVTNRPLPGEVGGPPAPNIPFVKFERGSAIVHGREGELFGVDDDHLHGTVGVDASHAPLWTPLPDLDWSKETREEKEKRHAHTCFNLRRSDSLSLHRPLGDKRHPTCARRVYDYHNLPKTSVVMVFFNEPLSPLYRSVVSILDRTPPELLHEIILIDDGSDASWLAPNSKEREVFETFIASLPKVHIKRIPRSGLMVARTQGALVATGETLTFLDSHIEVTKGWLEPLMDRIGQDAHHVVMPQIDGIDADTFAYRVGGIDILGFSWTLGQKGLARKRSPSEPMPSPIMAGGLFSINRQVFYDLGTYDQDMRLYGGEEMEISFRIWQCGFTLECIPCSHVGHVFRTGEFWHGQVYNVPGHEITRNKLRAADVWMDEYAKLVHQQSMQLPSSNPVGDLAQMVAIREKFQCKSFQWYLDNVYPENFIPSHANMAHVGNLYNPASGLCLASPRIASDGASLVSTTKEKCFSSTSQSFLFLLTSDTSELRTGAASFMDWCADSGNSDNVQIYRCHGGGGNQAWSYDATAGHIKNNNRCLQIIQRTDAPTDATMSLVDCKLAQNDNVEWRWNERPETLPISAAPSDAAKR